MTHIAKQNSIRKKLQRAWYSQCRGSAIENPRVAVLRRRYRAALKLIDLCSELHESIGQQIADTIRARVAKRQNETSRPANKKS